jgi:hypothetical protein
MYMLTIIEETASWTCEKIKAIRDLLEETFVLCKEKLSGSVYFRELIELIFVLPYCKISFFGRSRHCGKENRLSVPSKAGRDWSASFFSTGKGKCLHKSTAH